MANIDKFIFRLFRKGELNFLTLIGRTVDAVKVLARNSDNKILYATGTAVPSVGGTTYAKGALFVDTDVAAGTSGIYENMGTATSCSFQVVGGVNSSMAASLSTLVAAADSKATSVSVIASSNLVTGDSKAASLSVLVSSNVIATSTADSKALIADSKAVSVSVIASSNLVTSNSKAASNSTILLNHESRLASHSL